MDYGRTPKWTKEEHINLRKALSYQQGQHFQLQAISIYFVYSSLHTLTQCGFYSALSPSYV